MTEASPTGRLRERAAALRAAGRDVIDLSAGELADPTPEPIVDAAVRAARDPSTHHYGPAAGEPALRAAVAAWAAARHDAPVAAEQVAITNGAKQAVFNALRALLRPGDEVVIPSPYWPTFPAAVTVAGGVPVCAPTGSDTVLSDLDALERVRGSATRAVIVASPHNPTGLAYSADRVRELAGWAIERDLWVIADDTYADLAFEPAPSPALVVPAVAERLVTIGSTSKSHAMTGWRTGWLVAPAAVVRESVAIQSHTTSNVNRVAQAAAAAALERPDIPAGARARLRHARDRALALLAPLDLEIPVPDGAFFLFPDVRPFAADDVALAEALLVDAGVATVPGSAFGCPGHLRLSYGGEPDRVADGIGRFVAHLMT